MERGGRGAVKMLVSECLRCILLALFFAKIRVSVNV